MATRHTRVAENLDSGHRAGCLSSPNLRLETWRVLKKMLWS